MLAANIYTNENYSTIGRKLYLSEEMADIHFVFKSADGQCERIPAHKNFLVAVSDVFKTMYNETWREKDEIKIVDASAAEFREFLQFFYLEQVEPTMDNTAKVMSLGDKYNVVSCFDVYEKFVRNTVEPDNVCWAYGIAILFEIRVLKKICETIITFNTKEVFSSAEFLECDREVLKHILAINSFNCSEIDVFDACMRWVEAATGENVLTRELVDAQLSNLFHEIRFGSMTHDEFTLLIPPYGDLFSKDELNDIFQIIGTKTVQPKIFTADRRNSSEELEWNGDGAIRCDRSILFHGLTYYIKSVERTFFSTNDTLLLGAFWCGYRCSISYHYIGPDIPTEITIIEKPAHDTPFEKVIYQDKKAVLESAILEKGISENYPCQQTRFTLSKPILIRRDYLYEIRMRQTPPQNLCTLAVLETEVKMGSDITVRFHYDPTPEDDTYATGMILGLEFNRI